MTWLCASYLGGLIIIIIIFLSRSSASEQCPSWQGCGSHHCVGLPCLRKGGDPYHPRLTGQVSSCRSRKASEHLVGSLGHCQQPVGVLQAPTPNPCIWGGPGGWFSSTSQHQAPPKSAVSHPSPQGH